jgi:cellulose synthase/poly-beta-1,6-N-acetylglucosamine synthase-like glycosyltransferase
MTRPRVSFVVPCYRLAGLLPACLDSILRQSYADFEILVMDDCSPDDTAEVVASFGDARLRHVRNEHNLGHLRNYNKGIGLSRGAYVWLISADDYLRSTDVLARYVRLLDREPRVGYVFAPGYGVRNGVETRILGRLRARFDRDAIVPGEALLRRLLRGNFILTPSGLVRRECYDRLGAFPLDLPWCGDWYLWCLFALHFDVGYFAQPMVCYREQHDMSMTDKLTRESLDACAAEEIRVAWRIHRQVERSGRRRLSRQCLDALAHTYARTMAGPRYRGAGTWMNLDAMEASLRENMASDAERDRLRAMIQACAGDECYWRRDLRNAWRLYRLALAGAPWRVSIGLKMGLASLGKPGEYLRRSLLALR